MKILESQTNLHYFIIMQIFLEAQTKEQCEVFVALQD